MKLFLSHSVKTIVFFALSCVITVVIAFKLQTNQNVEKKLRFHRLSEQVVGQLFTHMQVYEHGLRGTRGVVLATGIDQIRYATFLTYIKSRDLLTEFPGMQGLGLIRRVQPEQQASFLQQMRGDNRPDFNIKQLFPHGGELFVTQFVEPVTQNATVVGLDMASEAQRYDTLMSTIRTGKATLSPLIQTADGKYELILLLPIYQPGLEISTETDRINAAIGLVYAPLQITDILTAFYAKSDEFSLTINDTVHTQQLQQLYRSSGINETEEPFLIETIPLQIYGRIWQITIQATPKFVTNLNLINPVQIAAYIIVFSTLLSLLYYYVTLNKIQELNKEKQALKDAIFESSLDALVTINHKGLITEFNKNAELMFGYKKDDVLNKSMAKLIIPERYHQAHTQGIKTYLFTKQHNILGKRIEIEARRISGEEFPIELVVVPIQYNNELFFTGFMNDISERQQAKEAIENAAIEAKKANEAKSAFLATMSHEIRTPLNAIIGVNNLLLTMPLSEEQAELVNIAHQAGINLLDLVNNILDYTKIEVGKMELDLQETDLFTLIDSVLSIMSAKAKEKNLSLLVSVEYPILKNPLLDALKVKQILINLVANAIKFTENGYVEIKLSSQQNEDRKYDILFSISDTGIGISEELKNIIFQEFTQADSSITRKYGGTGLGLALVQKFVTLLGGKIEVKNQEQNSGSIFDFTIPSPNQNLWLPEIFSELNCFYYNNKLNQCKNCNNNENYCFKTSEVLLKNLQAFSRNAIVIESLAEIPINQQLYLIFIDELLLSYLPVTELDILKSFTDFNYIKILLTEENSKQKKQQFDDIFDLQLKKTVSLKQLNEYIVDCIKSYRQGYKFSFFTKNKVNSIVSIRKNADVLLIEDSETNQIIISAMLTKLGYQVDIAINGLLGVKQAQKKNYTLILTDLSMPVMGGLEAATQIRNNSGLNQKTPIVALTANALIENKLECFEAGMNGFLTKPVQIHELKNEIEKHLNHTNQVETSNEAETTSTSAAIIDSEVLIRLKSETSSAMFEQLLNIFVTECDERITSTEQAILNHDFQTLKDQAHALKSVVATFGAIELTDILNRIDLFCKENEQEKAFAAAITVPKLWALAREELQKMQL